MQGELVWKSCMQDTTSKYSIFDMLELPDSSILCVGEIQDTTYTISYPYLLQLHSNGEILKSIIFTEYNGAYINYIDYFFQEIHIQIVPEFNNNTLNQFHFVLDLETENLFPKSSGFIGKSISIENDKRLCYKHPGRLFIINQEYDTLESRTYNFSSIKNLYYDSNSELIYGIGTDSDSINDILINQAGNLVLAGSVIFMDEEHASIYINDINTGHPVAGHIFYESLAQNSYRVVALDYGYALLQYAMKGQQSRKYIVRVSANGDFDAGIFNMQGVKVSETELDLNQQHFIDTSNLPNGNYMLQFIDNKNTALSNTFTISK